MFNEAADPEDEIAMNYTVNVKPKSEVDLICFQISVRYRDLKNNLEFLSCTMETGYIVKGMKDLEKEDENEEPSINLPDKLWIALFSMAYSHTRAILARSAFGSKFGHLILPPIILRRNLRKFSGKNSGVIEINT